MQRSSKEMNASGQLLTPHGQNPRVEKKDTIKSNHDIIDFPIHGNALEKSAYNQKSHGAKKPMVPVLLMRGGRPKTVNTQSASNANAHIMSLYSTAFSSHKNSVGYITHGRMSSQTEIRANYDLGSVKNGS